MYETQAERRRWTIGWLPAAARAAVAILAVGCLLPRGASAFTLEVTDPAGAPVFGFRYLVEEDTTTDVQPGVPSVATPAVSLHGSYSPVAAKGVVVSSGAVVDVPDDRRYFVSVLPSEGYANGGAAVLVGQSIVHVTVLPMPLPTAQISVFVFHDDQPLNNAPDIPAEPGLAGFAVTIHDFAGHVMMDAFGNPLGTEYDATGAMVSMGTGIVLSDANGEALIQNLAPGKYAVLVTPPRGENWMQTATLEGTPVVDAFVKSGEPPYFTEAGAFSWHVFFGFAHPTELPVAGGVTGSIQGQMVYAHPQRAPLSPGLEPGKPVDEAWVALNALDQADQMIYLQPTGPAGYFAIDDVPPGTYQLVLFDKPLDAIIDFRTVVVPETGGIVDMGKVPVFCWFGFLEGTVFYDIDADGYPDPGEPGIPQQAINIRWPDGSVYMSTVTDTTGAYEFGEVFPFFQWMVTEVDFARYKATGATFVVDDGGAVAPGESVTPQPQPENGGLGWRAETGVVLTEGMMLFAGNTNRIDWGKSVYGPGENGGISGIVFYATTRAENEPQFAAGEPWEPGVPRVQVNLYQDADADGTIDDLDGDGGVTPADVDNAPFGWADGGAMGPEDVDRDGDGAFGPGDAIAVATTDSWDDSLPTGCVGPTQTVRGEPLVDCAETVRTYNQLRPAIFDGGYAFDSYVPGGLITGGEAVDGLPQGGYIVEAVPPPGYDTIKEEDRNVDFGVEYAPNKTMSPIEIAPPCVGDPHVVPSYLTLFPGVESPFAGESRSLCDRKLVFVSEQRNAAADFFVFTEAPKAGRILGLVLNDVLLEFDPTSPLAGNNFGVPWLPISIQDSAGNEVVRTYTDEWGHYDALVPSTYTVNVPSPSGVSPNMLTACLNHPGPIPDPAHPDRMVPDPFYNPSYTQTCTNWEFFPGRTTRLDTPILPIAGFTEARSPVDCEEPDGTPLLYSVRGPYGDAWVPGRGGEVVIESVGDITFANPDPAPGAPGTITRDLGFGGTPGEVTFRGVPVPILAWDADGRSVRVAIPGGTREGQLLVTRGDNGRTSPLGVTLTAGRGPVVHVAAGGSIQDAIDAAPSGALVLVAPGEYRENVILWKKIRLQGSGAPSTVIQAGLVTPADELAWDAHLQALIAAGDIDLVPGERPDFYLESTPGVLVATAEGEFVASRHARLDGFTVTGAVHGGGVFVNAYAHFMEIANNRIVGNSGSLGGGIRVGTPSIPNDAETGYNSSFNDRVNIHHNQVFRNGAVSGGGGVALFTGADLYAVDDNVICANYSNQYGGGVAHVGLSRDGWIRRNRIFSNQSFDEGGGVIISGELVPGGAPAGTLTEGAGNVRIMGNLIQGNLAGDDGGGVRLLLVNGQDVQAAPQTPSAWHGVWLYNDLIVDNSSADIGGGVSLDDAARVFVYHTTIANNDSTATGTDAFGAPCVDGQPPGSVCPPEAGGGGLVTSVPQIAGLAARGHSAELQAAFGPGYGQRFSNPTLRNSIITGNRSFYWDAAWNGGTGGLRPDVGAGEAAVFWDLAVHGTTAPASLSPRYCLLTDATGTHWTNLSGDPEFVDPYWNAYAATSGGAALGNFVVTTFTPTGQRGDYHIQPTSVAVSSAVAVGGSLLAVDYDGDARPLGAGPDIGADEVVPPTGGPLLTNGALPPQTPRATRSRTPRRAADHITKPDLLPSLIRQVIPAGFRRAGDGTVDRTSKTAGTKGGKR